MMEKNDYRVPSLQRGLEILQLFHAGQRSLSMNAMAEALEVSVSALYRIVQTLSDMGYLHKIGTNSYELGPAVVSDGFRYLASRDIVEVAMSHLNDLRDRTSLSCHLSIREQTDSLYLYRAFAGQRLSVNIPIGSRIACHRSAMGRVLLCDLTDGELEQLYRYCRLDDHPPPGPRSLPELRHQVESDRERGWVLSRSDYSTAIACAIRDHRQRIIAAINLSGPEALLEDKQTQASYRQELLAVATRISRQMGAV